MFGHELVLCDVDDELILSEDLDPHLRHGLLHGGLREGRQRLPHHQDGLLYPLFVHLLCQDPYGLDADSLGLLREENDQLLLWQVGLVH
eukprot:CAMPEP_0183561610 /NCGR_PEP_ID=MMETSP0371-20130417/96854_1 /TAXON_ID=268820 /ORGANISM="Peridinium aciculiferum, Strain PAER-2" /LENGTH=88 /DNA_ID=CAMNT_0025770155 /DNA_START=250 /DNA_END=516 /DNA_ORIENTATION=+